jgi:hypothetical protein
LIKVEYPSVWKRRSKDMIISSGAYEREQFRRTEPLRKENKFPSILGILISIICESYFIKIFYFLLLQLLIFIRR